MASSARTNALGQLASYQTQIANFLPLPYLIDETASSSALEFAEFFTTAVMNSGLAGNAVVAAAYLGRIARSI
jgi:hypothetical protein